MPQFIIAYLGRPKPENPDKGQQQMAKWQTWVTQLGDAAVNPGTPLKNGTIVAPDGSVRDARDSETLSGFTVVEAESVDAAIKMARACPYGEVNGSLLVAEMMQMPGN